MASSHRDRCNHEVRACFRSSPDEWNQIVGGDFMAGSAVTVADPSGLWGLKSSATGNELMKATVSDLETSEGRMAGRDHVKTRMEGAKREGIRARAIEGVRQAASVVEAKAPADAQAYKDWLLHVSENVAAASKEGGFLGLAASR